MRIRQTNGLPMLARSISGGDDPVSVRVGAWAHSDVAVAGAPGVSMRGCADNPDSEARYSPVPVCLVSRIKMGHAEGCCLHGQPEPWNRTRKKINPDQRVKMVKMKKIGAAVNTDVQHLDMDWSNAVRS